MTISKNTTQVNIQHWPVLDCLGRRVEYLCKPPTTVELGFEARAIEAAHGITQGGKV